MNNDTLLQSANKLGTDTSKTTGIAFTPYVPPTPKPPVTPTTNPSGLSDTAEKNRVNGTTDLSQNNPSANYTADTKGNLTYNKPADQNADNTPAGQLASTNKAIDDAAQQFHDTMTGFNNGSIPLSPGEQAQVTGLQQSYQQLIDQQKQSNIGASGLGNIRGFQTGSAEYDPTFQAKTIGSIVSAGLSKVAALNTSMASAVAELTDRLRNNDFTHIKDAYDDYNKYLTDRRDTIQKTITDAQQAIKDAQAEKDKQQQYQLDVDKFNQTKDQNAFDNAFKVEQEKFAEQNKTDTLALEKFKAGYGVGNTVGGNITSTQMGPNNAPDPVSQKQTLDQISAQYGPMTAIAIKGLADYSINPMDWSSRAAKGMTREQAVTLAKMVDPTYSDAQYPTRAAYLKNLTSGTMAQGVVSANKAINHLIAFTDSVSNLGNTSSFSSVNNAANFITAHSPLNVNSGKELSTLNEANTEASGLKDELAKFFKGTGASDVKSIDDWSKNLDTGANPDALKGTVQGAINLLAGQLDVMNQQYQSTMGKAPDGHILQPQTLTKLSQLKNEGYTVDIPGVIYTDKEAYIKADPDAKDNMATAVKQLIAAGLELSPENILQMAQNQ